MTTEGVMCAACADGDHDQCVGPWCACWTDNALVFTKRSWSNDREAT